MITVEDDDVAAYAYLHANGRIVSSVWLANRRDTPREGEWNDPELLPFINPLNAVGNARLPVIRAGEDISAQWVYDGDRFVAAAVRICGQVWGVLVAGVKPGYSLSSIEANALARPLSEVPDHLKGLIRR